jgi:Zn-dependent M32 family carboxypeptidase
MSSESHDPRDIPILTEAVESGAEAVAPPIDFEAAHAAILTETLKLADSLLRQAAREIKASRFENLFDRLRAELPALVDRVMREQTASANEPEETRD